MEDISVWSKGKVMDADCRFCIRLITNDCIYFFQVVNERSPRQRMTHSISLFSLDEYALLERSMVLFDPMEGRSTEHGLCETRLRRLLEKQIEIRTNSSICQSSGNPLERNDGTDHRSVLSAAKTLCISLEYDRVCYDYSH